ncbi:hypothetical protein DAEQUDRAFT_495852 [Daedalea quercina L-15889]|uniref:DUF6534 domain-containing protein n=1 Tax=Daedalea quercina L-15889 TaxID=1314783 RepID=A0A165MKK7_9APHY|nr:hypothetical protein DAEQUDRAFT_495852 [Daedalea quercina L-15889]
MVVTSGSRAHAHITYLERSPQRWTSNKIEAPSPALKPELLISLSLLSSFIRSPEQHHQLVGLVFQWGLLGVLCLQSYAYVNNPANLVRRHKATVYVIVLLELVSSISLAVQLIQIAIQVPTFDTYIWSIYIVSPITTTTTQVFYARRIIGLSRKHTWTFVIGTFCALEIAAGVGAGISWFLYLYGRRAPFALLVPIWLGLNVLANVLIVVSMSITLSRGRWTTYSQSASIMTRLITIIVETGSLMASIYIFAFIVQFVFQWVLGIPLYLLSKLSACTLLACLNNPDPAVSGEGMYDGIDLVGDDTASAKVEMNSNVHGSTGYENEDAGLAYVQYEP